MALTNLSPCRSDAGRGVRRAGVLQGCLIALGIFVVLLIIGGIFVAMNIRGWTATGMTKVTEAAIKDAPLPQSEKQEIMVHVQQLADDFRDKKITLEQLGHVMDEIAESPIIPVGGVLYFEQKYITNSAMTEEEKTEARLTLDRFARGVYEEQIPDEALDEVMAPIQVTTPDGDVELKEIPTQEEIEQVLAAMKAKADEANVADEPFDVDISDELKAAIDRALAQQAEAAPN